MGRNANLFGCSAKHQHQHLGRHQLTGVIDITRTCSANHELTVMLSSLWWSCRNRRRRRVDRNYTRRITALAPVARRLSLLLSLLCPVLYSRRRRLLLTAVWALMVTML